MRRLRALRLGVALMLVMGAACSGAKNDAATPNRDVGDVEAGDIPGVIEEAGEDQLSESEEASRQDDVEGRPSSPSRSPSGPASPAAPGSSSSSGGFRSTLFSGDGDRRGITDATIRLCAHAALTFGAAFNTGAEDFNVYWTALNDAGGVHGRAVQMHYENDNYNATDAVRAATACKDKYDPFMLLGGLGFDQIPAVRNWAEQNKMLYLHHSATANGSEGKRYSYTGVPSVEKLGEMFAELALAKFRGQKIGVIKRQSENWEPGVVAFRRLAKQRGIEIVLERAVPQNKGSYLQDIIDLRNAGAEVVWLWLNALETTQFVKQSKGQGFNPPFMVFPFNLTTQSLGDDALNPPLVGVSFNQAYSKGDYSGEFAKYADDMKQFEAQYAKYRPNADLEGVAGDILFLNWSAQKALHQLLVKCGRDCTRNRIVELFHGFKERVTSSACELDWTRPGNEHRGGWQVSVLESYRAPDGRVNFRNIATCVEHLA